MEYPTDININNHNLFEKSNPEIALIVLSFNVGAKWFKDEDGVECARIHRSIKQLYVPNH